MAQFVTYNDGERQLSFSQRIGQYGLLRIVNIASLLVLIAAIPLTLSLSSRKETIEQHASQILPYVATSDHQPPSVTLVSLENGSTVAAGSTLTVQANATDNTHVARVEFSVDGTQECMVTAPPYTCLWQIPAGKGIAHIVTVRAYDDANNPGSISVGLIAQ